MILNSVNLPEPENVTRRLKNSLPDASENILTIDDVTSKSEKLKSINTDAFFNVDLKSRRCQSNGIERKFQSNQSNAID